MAQTHTGTKFQHEFTAECIASKPRVPSALSSPLGPDSCSGALLGDVPNGRPERGQAKDKVLAFPTFCFWWDWV
jgi:hypothetical protein